MEEAMPQISIIMPCLNMVNYIEKCIKSVIFQTLSNIEILIIDAGSTDGTLEILQTYSNKDLRIKIIHSQKKSYGYQVNLGIAAATGRYIGIVDTDDFIRPDMYEALYHVAYETKADYVKGTARMFYTITDTDVYDYPICQFSENAYGENGRIEVSPNQMPQLLTMDNFLWNGIYRRDLWKKIRLHESPGAAFQDLGGLLQTQINAHKGIYISKCVYEYRQDNVNASVNSKKGIHYVESEYAWAEQFLVGQPMTWYTWFYRKQFLHLMDRINAMAASEDFWEDSLSDMLIIAERLKIANSHGILTEETLTEEQWQDLQLFWEAPHFLYEKYRKIYELNRDSLQQVIHFLDKKRQWVIFGSGRLGKFIHAQLLSRNYKNVVAYCDNSKSVHVKLQYGVEILAPERVVESFPKAQYIVANKESVLHMRRQLEIMGIKRDDIVMYSTSADRRLFGERIVYS